MFGFDNIEYDYLVLESDLNQLLLEQMALESEFILNSCDANIVLEAEGVSVENKKQERAATLFQRIKEFFERIMSMFKTKTQELIKRDKQWIENLGDEGIFDDMDFKDLEIQMTPFWESSIRDIDVVLSNLKGLIDINKVPQTGEITVDAIINSNNELKRFVSKDSDFKTGLLKYFKVKDKSMEPVSIGGTQLLTMCKSEFLPFVKEYHNSMVANIQNKETAIRNASNKIENMIKNKQSKEKATESFCLIENSLYIDTDLRYCINSNVLFEAEVPADKKDDKQKNSLEIIDKAKEKETGDDVVRKFSDSSDRDLEYAKNILQINQIALTAAMTAVQNKYDMYMKALRGIVNARGGKSAMERRKKEVGRKIDEAKYTAKRAVTKVASSTGKK